MAYKVIDDDTALLIYEAVQENTPRSFGHYNRLRQLPRTKISGEIVFYLDALLDFSTRYLGRDETETLQEVIDAGVVSWFGNLDPELQKKAGFTLSENSGDALSMASEDADMDREETEDTIEALSKKVEALELAVTGFRNENERLSKEIESLEVDKTNLRREISHLEQINEELMEKTLAEETSTVKGPAFLSESTAGSVYTEMTTHLLTPVQGDKTSASKKKNVKKKKRA
jgi:regulator of replication initiation timing